MSDTNTTETSSSSSSSSQNYAGFISGLTQYSIHIIITFILIGSIGLYICKVAQANVLPDNILYTPFGDKVKEVEEIPININVVKVYGLMGLAMLLGQKPTSVESTKIVFDDKEVKASYENGIIGFLDSFKSNPERASFFGLYVYDIFAPLIANNNWFINKIFSFMNKYLTETVIILFFPIILSFLIVFLIFVNTILCIFYQIKHWSDFFMNKNIKNNTVTWSEPFTYLRPWRWFLFFLYCLFLFFPVVSCLPLITTLYSIFAPLGLSAHVYKSDKTIGFLSFMRDVIMYKSQLYLILFSFGLFIQSSTYLGYNGLIGCFVGILIVMFVLNLYKQVIPTNDKLETEGLVSNAQAKIITKGGSIKKSKNKVK